MSQVTTHIIKTGLEKAAARAVSDCLLKNKGRATLFLISGGSSLKLLDFINPESLGNNLTFCVLDDRYSTDPKVNNFLQIMASRFYTEAVKRGAQFISTVPLENETLEQLGHRFDKALRTWDAEHDTDREIVATLGIGPDGHIAGMMPFPEDEHLFAELFEHESLWAIGYDAGNKNEYHLRVTVTISFLTEMVNDAFIYVSGQAKKDILQTIMKGGKLSVHPAFVIHLMKKVELFSDIDLNS